MKIWVLDPVRSHEGRECKMRIATTPDHKQWHCLDCGVAILWTQVEVEEVDRATVSVTRALEELKE